jgi:hypothetical protein
VVFIEAICSPEMTTRHRYMKYSYLLLTLCFVVFFPDDVSAHAPHDEVRALVLSPAYPL